MKRFFMCCVVVIVALFLGFTAYYFIANKENITLASEHSSAIKLNVNDTLHMDDIIVHTLPSSGTFIDVKFSVDGIISYDKETKTFTAEKVGDTVVTLTPSNAKFGPFVLSANVGDGRSAEYPYYIRTADELASIGASGSSLTTGMSYELIADIYLTDRAWTPIANGVDAGFTGTFDGANHVIYDMKISGGTGSAGMFAKVAKGAVVERITFVNASISGDYTYAGIVAGQNNGTISLCQVLESSITNGNGATGGIVGWNNFTQQENGGLSARIGMCGIENSSITAGGDVGGIAGANTASIIENCYVVLNSVNGNSTAKFGGIVGKNVGYNGSFDKVSTIYKSYAYVPSVTSVAQASGIAATNTDANSSVKNTFVYNIFAMETSNYVGTSTSATSSDIVKKSAADLKNPDTYTAWDFNRVWEMDENYAVVNFQSTYSTNISESIIFVENIYPTTPEVPGTGGNGGSGSGSGSGSDSSSPIIIPGTSKTNLTSQSDVWAMLKVMSDKPNGNKAYTIAANITVDLSQASTYGVSFPLGTKEKPFTYQLYPTSSQRITFTNLSVSGKDYASFFGYMGTGATVSGLIFQNASVSGNSGVASGVVAAYLESGVTLANCTVKDSAITASGNNVGFIAGASKGSLVGNSVEDSTMTTTGNVYGGAIVGSNASAVLKAKVVRTAIVANGIGHFGGVAGHSTGYVDNSTVNALALNATSANVQAGGLIGHNTGSASGNLVKDSTITASTTQSSAYAGGLMAVNSGKTDKNSFLNSTATGYYVGGIAALNSGTIQRTIAGENHLGKVSGIYAGGLVSINQTNGFIENCLVGLQMVTIKGSDKTCGFAYKLEAGSLISHSFSYAVFFGNDGEKYCDTNTPFRQFYAGLASSVFNQPMGKIENSLFCNVSNTHIYGFGILPDSLDESVKAVQVTEAEAKGSNNWMKFHENGFALSSIWKRTQGQWLSLQ